jgi:hypothetical protein
MPEHGIPRVTTEEEALGVLLESQRREGCIPTLPASGSTIETDAGWAFFNINGYLGTVTENGDVIEETGFESE